MRKRIWLAGAVVLVAFGLSCSDDTRSPITPTAPTYAKGGAKVKSISVSPPSATITVGQTLQLTATVSPASASTTIAWASSNNSVATVSQAGVVSGVAAGSASISASGGGATGTSAITVVTPPPPGSVVMVGAGDIASCSSAGDEATATLLDGIDGTVFNLGDNVYDSGTAAEFTNCYSPTWGRHKARTKPSPGNHEYGTAGAAGYFGYFGAAAGDPSKGYYSYNLGDWHVVVLNSNLSCAVVSCAPNSPQEQWLRGDLAANTKLCTLAYWHHPRFNSGAEHGNDLDVSPLWDALYQYNADVILNGHEHIYERFAPQNPSGVADNARGIREFIVGTGGRSHYTFGTIQPNSEVRNSNTYGVLKLTLSASGYSWQFVPVAGATFTDSGSGSCH